MRYLTNDQRDRWIEQVKDLSDENTKSGAIDVALQHYITDYHTKQELIDQLPVEVLEELGTPHLPIKTDVTVGDE